MRIVDMQLAEGLVSRLEDPDDRSANLLSRFLKNVSDEDLAVIVRGLAKVEAVLVSELSA